MFDSVKSVIYLYKQVVPSWYFSYKNQTTYAVFLDNKQTDYELVKKDWVKKAH